MKRCTKSICAMGLLGCSILGASGCADNDNMLVIVGAMSSTPPDCKYNASGSSELLLVGRIDAAFGGYYQAVLLVSNQLMAKGSKARLRAESSDVEINNAEVTLLQNGKSQIGASYSVPASGLVRAGSGDDFGYGTVPVRLMPGVEVPALTQYIIAEVRLQGTTSGGRDIESNLFRFEIDVGDSRSGTGLVEYNAVDANTGALICDPTECKDQTEASSCFVGQDSPVSCCACLSNAVCNSAG